MLLLPILILPRDADSVELRAPLVTPIFDFHLVISSLTTPTQKFLISCTAVLPNIHVDDFTLFSCCKHRLSSDVHNSLGPFYASNLPFCHFIINWARISGYK